MTLPAVEVWRPTQGLSPAMPGCQGPGGCWCRAAACCAPPRVLWPGSLRLTLPISSLLAKALRALTPAPLHQLGAWRRRPGERGRRSPGWGRAGKLVAARQRLFFQAVLRSRCRPCPPTRSQGTPGRTQSHVTAPPPGSLPASPRLPAASAAGSERRRWRRPWGESGWVSPQGQAPSRGQWPCRDGRQSLGPLVSPESCC